SKWTEIMSDRSRSAITTSRLTFSASRYRLSDCRCRRPARRRRQCRRKRQELRPGYRSEQLSQLLGPGNNVSLVSRPLTATKLLPGPHHVRGRKSRSLKSTNPGAYGSGVRRLPTTGNGGDRRGCVQTVICRYQPIGTPSLGRPQTIWRPGTESNILTPFPRPRPD